MTDPNSQPQTPLQQSMIPPLSTPPPLLSLFMSKIDKDPEYYGIHLIQLRNQLFILPLFCAQLQNTTKLANHYKPNTI
jgi:hypothetical protein